MSLPLTTHCGVAAPMLLDNVNTDTIIPSREMKRVSKTGLSDGLFANVRYSDGKRLPNLDFIVNKPVFDRASILLAGTNFGCGSSREHAVWALLDFGFRVIIAESFGAIFHDNCVANGILPVRLSREDVTDIAAWVETDPSNNKPDVSLVEKTVWAAEKAYHFTISDNHHHMLINGHSPIDITLNLLPEIEAFMSNDGGTRPWLYGQDNR